MTLLPDPLTPEREPWQIEAARLLGPPPEAFLAALEAAGRTPRARREAVCSAGGTPDSPADALTALLVGGADDRFGPRMDPEGRELVRTQVWYWIETGEPVRVLVMWGGLKHYVRDQDQGIDLAELFAVQQFRQLVRHAREIYPPGVVILFCLEDFGVWYQDACGYGRPMRQSVERSIARYLGEFETLLRSTGADWARPLRFPDLVGRPFDRLAYVRHADRNLELLRAYWEESASCGDGDGADLDSYRRLMAAGWSGQIPSEMRQHYLQRLTKLYPGASTPERVDRLLRYFAIVLLYQQLRVFAGMGGPLIKIAMYKPAPGLPGSRVTGRIHLRCLPRRLTSQVMPPWTCKGCFRINRDGTVAVALQSFPLAWQQRLRFDPGWLWVGLGRDRLRIRADVLLPDTIEGGAPLGLKHYGLASAHPGLEGGAVTEERP
jgi:hypothetical protein